MKNSRISILLFILVVSLTSASGLTDDEKLVSAWIASLKQDHGTALELGAVQSSAEYQYVINRGPNILPELVEAYKNENNAVALRALYMAIRRVSLFSPVLYNSKPGTISSRGYSMGRSDDSPNFAIDVSKEKLDSGASPASRRSLLLWWVEARERGNDVQLLSNYDSLTSGTPEPGNIHTDDVARKYEVLQSWGIFALPDVIAASENPDNNYAFLEFLRLTNRELYDSVYSPKGWSECAVKVKNRFPASSDRASIIREWWSESKSKFNELHDLSTRIDDAVGSLQN